MDRDGKFCDSFRAMLNDEGVKCVQLPPRSPNLNPHLERFFGISRPRCLERMIFFGEMSLRQAIHALTWIISIENETTKGLGNKIIEPSQEVGQPCGHIECQERLGGLLKYYHRNAA